MEIIPAIDLMQGQCVRLSEGDFARRTTYAADPLSMAQRFEAAGLRRLHLVDLDGARAGHPVNLAVLERLARHTELRIDAGGGIQTDEALAQVLAAGARATVEGWLRTHGAEVVFLGADFKAGRIMTGAWSETSGWLLDDFIAHYLAAGARTFICTDVGKDGLLQGPSLATYRELLAAFPQARFIASGGVASIADLVALAEAGMHGVIIGKALYEGRIALEDLRRFA